MATIDDIGGAEPLGNPPLGGPDGWAAAVRDYLKNLAATKVNKAGDTMTGNLTVSRTGGPTVSLASAAGASSFLSIARPAGFHGIIQFNTDALRRWHIRCNDMAESGGNTGSNLIVYRYDDAGTVATLAAQINRATGEVSFYGPVAVSEPTAATHAANKGYVDAIGTWQDYTPTVNGATVSEVRGRWTRIGNTVHVTGRIIVSALTGDIGVTLPVAPSTLTEAVVGDGVLLDADGARYPCAIIFSGTDIRIRQIVAASGSIQPVSPTAPFTWAAGDRIAWSLTYETAAA